MAKITRVKFHKRYGPFTFGTVWTTGIWPVVGVLLNQSPVFTGDQTYHAGDELAVGFLALTSEVKDGARLAVRFLDCEAMRIGTVDYTLRIAKQEPKGPGDVAQPKRGGLAISTAGRRMALSTTARKR